MASKVVALPAEGQGPHGARADHDAIRDAIATRAHRLDARWPQAVDLCANALGALRRHLMGVASIVSGTIAPEHFREALRGERSFDLLQLCRLAVSDRAEARRAVEAVLEVLAAFLGLALVPKRLRHSDPHETGARVAVVSAAAVAAIFGALQNDGKVDGFEAIALRPHAAALRDVVAAVDGLAAGDGR